VSAEGRILEHKLLRAEGLPKAVLEKREPLMLEGNLGEPPPGLDLAIVQAPLRWLLGQPISVGSEAAGALIVGGIEPLGDLLSDRVRDGARQLAVGLQNAWTHDRLREKSVMLAEQGATLQRANKVKT
jgi:hypothetical protein